MSLDKATSLCKSAIIVSPTRQRNVRRSLSTSLSTFSISTGVVLVYGEAGTYVHVCMCACTYVRQLIVCTCICSYMMYTW